ncbi:M10 family metallopeptidase C-terminal domain-containing protein [Caulobacter sp. LARHSG274]
MSILFTNGDNETDAGALELDGASFITSADVGGATYVFVAGGVDNGISVFSLALDGTLTNVANITDSGLLNLVGVSGLSTITSDGNTYLIAAGAGDNGLSVFRVGVNGAPTSVDNVADAGALNLGGVSRVATATVGGTAYVFAAGTNDDGISVFSVAGDGKLTSLSNLADNGTYELDGVKGLTTAVIGGTTYLFAAGGVDDGVSVFSVSAAGALTHTSSVTDNGTLKLDGASDVATAVVGGITYLFVTGAVDNGLSVFSVNASGVLANVANVSDTASLRLAGATGITVNTFGATTYLTVGGTENGLSTFRVNAGGTLTAMENIDDGGSKELAGTTQVHSASVGGTNYLLGAGSTDDGVSVFGLKPSGQLWFTTEGGDADTRIVRINNDGSSQTINIDNTPGTDPLPSSFQADVGLDTAAGFYFGLTNSGPGGDNAILVRGAIGSSATPTTVVDFPDTVIINGMQVDAINHKIYVGYQDGSGTAPANTGIRVYGYNPLTGAISDQGFLVTSATDSRGQESGFDVLDPRDFALDSTVGRLFYTELLTGGVAVTGLFRLDLASPNTTTQLVSQTQFPDDGSNGYIYDVEVDTSTDLVYFTTESNAPSPFAGYNAAQNAIWYISENASSGTAVKVTLVGAVAATFYPGDMTFDQVNRQLYVESEDDGSGSTDDVIYVFQLDALGTTATLINTFFPSPTFVSAGGNIQGMVFSQLPTLGNLNGTASQPVEQAGAATVLLTGAPTITDTDGDHLSGSTVQITGGKFASNEASTSDDHLGYGAGMQASGLIAGTNITVSWNAATETLTLDGYDTLANYQAVLAAIRFQSTGDNPTNYGLNLTRTVTWTLDDGTPDIPAGGVNSGTTTITLAAVNDAPINGTVTSASGLEDAASIAVTGLQIDDPDANPALQAVTVTLSVNKGVLTLLTNVSAGLTSGEVSGNGTGTVTITATLNAINATLAAASGLLFTGAANDNGTATLTVVTNDGGGSGSGGAQSDTDGYTITITAVNDAPLVGGDGTESLAATNEDVANAGLTNTVSTLFAGQYDDSADQVSGGSSANAFAGVAITANGSSGSTGQWQYYNGSTWVNVGAASTAAAVLLAATTPLRFLPAADFNGPGPTLTAHLVDASGGALTNGAVVNVTTSGGSTRYSVGTVVLDHTVTAVNDAPVTVGGAAVALTTILEDAANPAGQTVSALFASHFSDSKDQVSGGSSADALTGVAITANTATAAEGTWQYFSGAWQDIPAVATNNAFILDAATLVRFLPAADFNGPAPALVVYMIDDSAGAATTGQTADLTTTGGATPYGTALTLSETVTAVNDPHTGGVSITGAATEDQVLTADTSTLADVDGLGTLHYDWQRDAGSGFASIGAADQATYALGDADVGATVRVVVSYTDNGGTAESATSAATAAVANVNDNPTGGVSITGAATEDQVLTAVSTLADADGLGTLHYQWQHDVGSGFVNVGSDQATYTLGDADVGGVVRVVISYTDLHGTAESATSAATAAVANINDPHTGGASVTGTATEDQVLTAGSTLADADGLGMLHYQWQHDVGSGFVNVGSDQATYTLGDADVGGVVRVVISYTDLHGTAESATSAATAAIANINDAPTGGVSITGTTMETQVLTADTSVLADPDGLGTLHYDWQRDTGSGFASIGAADQSTYTLDGADVGATVRVVVSYTDLHGTAETATSAATAAIANFNNPPTGGVSITGAATEDQVLTADTSTLADGDGLGTLHYDWQHNVGSGFVSIGAADQATYALGDADVGGTVRVRVSYTDLQGAAESVTSAATAAIANINDPHTGGVSITGSATEDQVLTAVSTLADADGLGTLHYDWQHDVGSGFVSIGAVDQATYAPVDADVGGLVRVVVSYTDAHGTAETATSAATAVVAGANDPHTGGASITGTPTEDQVLTAVSTLADVDGLGTLHYQWQRNVGSGYANVVGATASTYTLSDADVGGMVRVVVSYTDGQGFAESATSAGTAAIANINDPHTGGVSITGAATEDQVLTAISTLADADGLGTLHYQWQHNVGSGYVDIVGAADQATYTLGDADVGGTVRVRVSYTDAHGTAETATSAGTAAIANVNDAPTGGVAITGTTTENQILTADTTALADADGLGTLHYQWQRNSGSGFVNVGSDQATYTLGDADVGGTVRVRVSYVDGQATAETVTSAASAAIAGVNDPHTGGVSVTGAATEDQVLTAVSTLADVDGLGTLHYQWQRNVGSGYADVVGATAATYTLGDADVGGTVRVVVGYTDGQGFAESATSSSLPAIANVNDAPTGAVAITGTAAENQVLTADTSTLADADGLGALHYQWQRDGGSGFVNVGSDQATYALDDPDVGATIRVVVSYVDGQGAAESKTSAATAAVTNGNDPHTGGVSLTGTATEDQVLTAVSTLADADGLGTLHYDWQRDTGSGFASLGAADQATYALGDADVGGLVRVVVSYTDGGGFAETATSAATAAVANVNDAPTGAVTISGSVTEDQVLTAVSTLADVDGLGTLHYQWQRDSGSGFANVGSDQATYALGDADVGAAIRVVASYTDGRGAAEAVASAATAAVANVNDAPVAANDAASVTQRLSTTGSVRANDTDIDNAAATLTVTSVAFNLTHADQAVVGGGTVVNGGYGQLTINPDGTYSYLANQEGLIVGQVVTDRFDYTVSDPSGATATAQLTVTVTGSATGDANANILISDGLGHTLTGRGGADILTGAGGADIFAYEAVGDSPVATYDTITDFAHGVDSLRLTPLMTASTKLTLVTDGTNKVLEIDQNGDGTAEDKILVQGQGLQVTDVVTGVADFGFSIQGSSGADVLTGGTGADLMTGGGGADTFAYAAGDSTFAHWDMITDFTPGVDKIDVSAADGGVVAIARLGASSFIYFGNPGTGLSVVQVNGDVQADDLIVSGAVTGVTLYGGTDVETLRGGAGMDVLVGGTANTTLIGGGGTDILYGGPATDTFLYTSIADSNFTAYDLILGFNYGTDKVDISAIDGGKVTLARYEGNTFIYSAPDAGGALQSAIVVQGTTLKSTDLITSGGPSQAFVLVGDGASHNVADVLVAAGGNDILYGLDGADTLTGGGGADFLVGGTGADTFVFAATTDSSAIASDLVWSFSTAEGDRIDLTGIDANSATAANDAFTVVSAFSSVAGQLVISAADSSGYSHLSADVNGDGIADFVLALTVATTLTASDILL